MKTWYPINLQSLALVAARCIGLERLTVSCPDGREKALKHKSKVMGFHPALSLCGSRDVP